MPIAMRCWRAKRPLGALAARGRGAARASTAHRSSGSSDAAVAGPLRRRLLGQVQLSLGRIDDCMRTTEEAAAGGLAAAGVLPRACAVPAAQPADPGRASAGRARLAGPIAQPPLRSEPVARALHEAQWLFVTHAEVALYLFSISACFTARSRPPTSRIRSTMSGSESPAMPHSPTPQGMVSLPQISAMYLQQADALRQGQRGTSADFKFLRCAPACTSARAPA